MLLNINVEFNFGDVVFLKIDEHGEPGTVIEYHIYPGIGCDENRSFGLMYGVKWADKELDRHYGIELTKTRKFVVAANEFDSEVDDDDADIST